MNDNYDKIEEEVKEKDAEKKSASGRTKHKVSGRSVFELQDIIKSKGENKEGKNKKSSDE